MSDGSVIVEDNGYATIRRTPDSVQVLAWYTPPLLSIPFGPLEKILPSLFTLWVLLRLYSMKAAQQLAPSVDRIVAVIVSPFEWVMRYLLGTHDILWASPLMLSSGLGNIAACIGVGLASILLLQWGISLVALVIRFPIRVEIQKDIIRIGRRRIRRTGAEGFAAEPTTAAKNNRIRTNAYDRSMRVIFESGAHKLKIAEVFGVDRAEGIVLALHEALNTYGRF